MSAHQNLTVRLPTATIDRARVLAAQRGSSISAMVAETIEHLAAEGDAYEAAKRMAMQHLEQGLPLGGGPYLSRDGTHER